MVSYSTIRSAPDVVHQTKYKVIRCIFHTRQGRRPHSLLEGKWKMRKTTRGIGTLHGVTLRRPFFTWQNTRKKKKRTESVIEWCVYCMDKVVIIKAEAVAKCFEKI